jgi:hypothetical protein
MHTLITFTITDVIELSYDPVILLLVIHPKEHESGYSRNTCKPKFIAAQFTIAKLWKEP